MVEKGLTQHDWSMEDTVYIQHINLRDSQFPHTRTAPYGTTRSSDEDKPPTTRHDIGRELTANKEERTKCGSGTIKLPIGI